MRHIEPSKLFGAVEGRVKFDDNEQRHFAKCEDCDRVFAVFQTYIGEEARERDTGSRIERRQVRRFKQGDRVCVVGPIAENYPGTVGIVRDVTFGGNVYRYVVQFEDGTLETFFGLRLRPA